jgi:hypothetical protein
MIAAVRPGRPWNGRHLEEDGAHGLARQPGSQDAEHGAGGEEAQGQREELVRTCSGRAPSAMRRPISAPAPRPRS